MRSKIMSSVFFVKFIKPIFVLLNNIGFSPIRFLLLLNVPRYLSQLREFRNLNGVQYCLHPIVSDYGEQAGSARGHYFHQDLLVATLIYRANPQRHIDIGSRIDGFIAHVASFRKIEVIDIRDLNSVGHENISFLKADLMNVNSIDIEATDSISCLHAIEHFGLGRYGDPINPNGHIVGFKNILKMLKSNGILYISFPIGMSTQVHFNAHRIFHPNEIFDWFDETALLSLERFDYVDDNGDLHSNVDLESEKLNVVHGCGIYIFRKK